jgi:hypothetical protein
MVVMAEATVAVEEAMVAEEEEVCISPLVVFDRSHSYTYCTPFQAMEDVADMMTVVAEVCSL